MPPAPFASLLPFIGFASLSLASALIPVGIAAGENNTARLLFHGDFEDSSMAHFGDSEIDRTAAKTQIVTSPVRAGRRALEVCLDWNAGPVPGDNRTDFWIRGMSNRFALDEEYWFGFSPFFPESWEPDTRAELFLQWIGEGIASPPLAIYLYGENYRIMNRWIKVF